MKNFIFVTLFILGLIATTGSSAQMMYARKAYRKDWKMDKKDSKVGSKMFRDRPRAAARKRHHAYKKSWKRNDKEDRFRFEDRHFYDYRFRD